MIIGQMTITIEPEDIRRYIVAQDWTDDQVQAFIARWQSSITDQLVDTLLGPGGLLADYMSDPDCLAWVSTPDNTQEGISPDVARVNYYCTHCRDKGIEDVDAMPAKDTTMYWEKDAQEWRLSDDTGFERPYCTSCGSEQLEEEQISSD